MGYASMDLSSLSLRLVLACGALAACASPPAAPPTATTVVLPPADSAAPATEEVVVKPEPAPPTHPLLESLPAISEDGTQVAVWAQREDGARANPKSELLLFEAGTDNVQWQKTVHDADEHDEIGPDAAAENALARMSEAEKELGRRAWRRMTPLVSFPDPKVPARMQGLGTTSPQLAQGVGVMVRFAEPTLLIDFEGKSVYSEKHPDWSDVGSTSCAAALADLESAWIDSLTHTTLVLINYAGGTDICWEPESSYHTVRF